MLAGRLTRARSLSRPPQREHFSRSLAKDVLPTHQVNALYMSPGGYRNADYIRAGGMMTVVFLAVAVAATWLLFL
jgi:hypothetical protein